MLHIVRACGPAGWVLAALTAISIYTFIKGLVKRSNKTYRAIVLFWGILGALLGFLGQTTGIYSSLAVIQGAESISPDIVSVGLAESFIPSIWGFSLLSLSLCEWGVLYLSKKSMKGDSCETHSITSDCPA